MLHLQTDSNGYLTMLIKYRITWNSHYVRWMEKDCGRDLRDLLRNYTSPDLRNISEISRKANQFSERKSASRHVNCFPLAVIFKSVATQAFSSPIPVTARSKTRVCGSSLARIAGSNPAGDMVVSRLRVLCVIRRRCFSVVRRNPTECGVSECDLETSTMSRPRPTRAVEP